MTEELVGPAGTLKALIPGSSILLHHFFRNSVRQWPDRPAVELPPGSNRPNRRVVSYAELAREADTVAAALADLAAESIVAVLLPRSTEWLYAAQIGVLESGCAYVCIDPSFPEGRVREITEDSAAVALITDEAGAARAKAVEYSGRILKIGELAEAAACGSKPRISSNELSEAAPNAEDPAGLAYIIYTSGTTGRPKGVMIEHRSIVNLIAANLEEIPLTPGSRVSQNSSSAYDSSVEEIWSALAAGATLVVMDEETVRLGPDLPAWLRRERINFIAPPPTLLRAMSCEDPAAELPDLTCIYAGGEPLPQDLADLWSKTGVLLNTYGPTECAVTATRGAVRPGEPIHIGRLVPGIQAWVLNDRLEEVADGEWGELCLGGIGLARGYRNRPELTAAKFVHHPQLGRIYRTGDLVHRGADGNFYIHGRADSQVKIRGYRVELEEIEARLAACEGVRAAACNLEDGALAGFIVPEDGWKPESFSAVADALRTALPDYMVPSKFGTIEELPLTISGKLNRAALPRLNGRAWVREGAAPRNALEARLADVFRDVIGLEKPAATDIDFFDLGGNSLRAAQLVSRLRKDDPATAVTVRDVYETRTVAGLATRMAERAAQTVERALSPAGQGLAGDACPAPISGGRPFLATVIQAVFLLVAFCGAWLVSYWSVFEAAPWAMRRLGLIPSLLLAPMLFTAGLAAYTPLTVWATAVLKRLLIGRYQPLRAPIWGSFYVRNWMVQRTAHAIPWWLIEGTGFQAMALRALGARVGRRVHIHSGVDLRLGGWDLLEIGDDVTIAQEAEVGLVTLEKGEIVVGPVSLGRGAKLDIRSGVSAGTRLGEDALLTALSWLAPGGEIPAGQRWDGVPAKPAGRTPARPKVVDGGRSLPPLLHDCAMVLARCIVDELPLLIPDLALALGALALHIDAERVLDWLDNPSAGAGWLLSGIALVAFSLAATQFIQAGLARALGKVREGVIDRWSLDYIRVRLKTEILDSAGAFLGGALLWPVWLRLAGMKIGRRCEIASIMDTVPELVEIGDGTFLADIVYIGGPVVDRGTVTLTATRLGNGVYIGNLAVIPAGRHLRDDVLLGVCTVAGEEMGKGGGWFGHPAFELPRREVVAWDRSATYEPTPLRYAIRWFWELLRYVAPAGHIFAWALWIGAVSAAQASGGWLRIAAAVCLAGLGVDALLCIAAIAGKWALLGRAKPGQHPFWACWCGRWDYMYVLWEDWARPTLLHLEGTLLLNWFLRAMGVRLGKRVALGPGLAQVVDPDMLIVEDGATVSCMFQAHTFEDRVLKMDYVRVRRGATLGFGTMPLYGAEIGAAAYVAPHAVVMKDEMLLAGITYEGAPASGSSERGTGSYEPEAAGRTCHPAAVAARQ